VLNTNLRVLTYFEVAVSNIFLAVKRACNQILIQPEDLSTKMSKSTIIVVLCVLVCYANSNPVIRESPRSISKSSKISEALNRPKRWALTTMLIQGALQQQAEKQSQANTIDESFVEETSKTNEALRLRSQGDKEIDLSGDTLVNYRRGRGETGALTHEEDAEVYNWRLLQEDKERELMGDRTHSTTNPPRVTYNTEDTIKAYKSHGHRPLSGYIRSAANPNKFVRFYRVPITVEETMNYSAGASKSGAETSRIK